MLQGFLDGVGVFIDFLGVVGALDALAREELNSILIADLGQRLFAVDLPALEHAVAPGGNFLETVLGFRRTWRVALVVAEHNPV